MKKTALIFLSLLLLFPCSCKRYSKEDIVGVWRVEKTSGHKDADLDRVVWLMSFDKNGEFRNFLFDLEKDVADQDESFFIVGALLSGEWELKGDSIEVQSLTGHEDVISIESLERDEIVITHKTVQETFSCSRFAEDLDEAAMLAARMRARRLRDR